MIPVWSAPRSTSSSARIIPSDTSPRTFRRSSVSPFGSTAPGSATATVAPAPKFHAPQTIERASPSPTSTLVSCSRSAFGCFTASTTRPTRKRPRLPSSSATPRVSIPSTSAEAIDRRVASSSSGISSGTYSASQLSGTLITRTASARVGRPPRGRGCPECRDVAARCARARSRRRSRSTRSGSRPTFSKTRGSTIPAPPISIQPENLHVRQPAPSQIPHETSGSIDGSVNGK